MEALSKFLSIDEKELLTLWLTDKVLAVLNTEKNIAGEVLKIAKEIINELNEKSETNILQQENNSI